MLHDRRRAYGQVGAEFFNGSDVLLERSAILDAHALGFEPVTVGVRPLRLRARRADVGHIGAALDQKPRDKQFRALIA